MGEIITIDFLKNINKKNLRNKCKELMIEKCPEVVTELNRDDPSFIDKILDCIILNTSDFDITFYDKPITCYYLHQKKSFEIYFVFQDIFLKEQRLIFCAEYE